MTVDEELGKLEENIRRVKIEYEAYFNGGLPRPPYDTIFRIESAIKKYSSELGALNFGQRFRFNQLAQKYAVYSDLWRKKTLAREEGRGRAPSHKVDAGETKATVAFSIVCSDPEHEPDKVEELFRAVARARAAAGEDPAGLRAETFARFIREKTLHIKQSTGCEKVRYSVAVEDGKVKFKATKA